MDASYITSAAKAQQLPNYSLPEVAFVGRSNTGKSTLLNALTGHRQLARASRTPGRTQMVNFFSVGGKKILADLPGYGYSVAKREVVAEWQELLDTYIQRQNIQDYIFLLDSRRTATQEDLALMALLGANLPLVVVLTKSDKLSQVDVRKAVATLTETLKKYEIPVRQMIPVSALKKTGLDELRRSLRL